MVSDTATLEAQQELLRHALEVLDCSDRELAHLLNVWPERVYGWRIGTKKMPAQYVLLLHRILEAQ